MDYKGKTPAQLYAQKVESFEKYKSSLEQTIQECIDQRHTLLRLCTHEYPTETIKAYHKKEQDARAALYELYEEEQLLVLLSPLYNQDTE